MDSTALAGAAVAVGGVLGVITKYLLDKNKNAGDTALTVYQKLLDNLTAKVESLEKGANELRERESRCREEQAEQRGEIADLKHKLLWVEAEMRARMPAARFAMETLTNAVIVVDSDGIIAGWTGPATVLLGWTADEVLGHNISTILPSPQKENYEKYLLNYQRTGKSQLIGGSKVIKTTKKTGEEITLELSIGETKNGAPGKYIFTAVLRPVN